MGIVKSTLIPKKTKDGHYEIHIDPKEDKRWAIVKSILRYRVQNPSRDVLSLIIKGSRRLML